MKLPISAQQFLAEYWQQKPLYLPQAIPDFQSPITPDELAGFALEADIESRLIWQDKGIWGAADGPFTDNSFQRQDLWTLLVQQMDRWHPAIHQLRLSLAFLPNWRVDDVMVSYAVEGAGVGPHFDRYDVFLLQGQGQREWRLGPACDESTPQLGSSGLNLIPEFEPEATFLLNPGDVLYVPPSIAHWGIARSASMTFSIGLRAPSIAALLARRTDAALERLSSTVLLEDGATAVLDSRPGEITAAHLANARDAIANAVDVVDDGRWLGELLTEQGDSAVDPTAYFATPSHNEKVKLSAESRVAWREHDDGLDAFINGECITVSPSALPYLIALCSGDAVMRQALDNTCPTLSDALSEVQALVADPND
ncbi:cupin domain-containing protein [Luminiphilus sp.]|nr:cupin domain-containing protein [Luminiphilus sp.]